MRSMCTGGRWGGAASAAALLFLLTAGCGDSSSNDEPVVTGDAGADTVDTGAGGSGGGSEAGSDVAVDAPGKTTLSLPQFVRGAARVNTAAFAQIPLVIETTGAASDAVQVKVDDGQPIAAVADGTRWVATLDTKAMGNGSHPIVVSSLQSGAQTGTLSATLSVASDSLQLTDYATVGPGFNSNFAHDKAGDRIALTWTSVASGHHQTFLNFFDGAFQKLEASDLVISEPSDTALAGWTAFGKEGIGVVYLTPKPNDVHWLVKMRVVGWDGAEKMATAELTEGEAAFHDAQAGADPGGFSAAWLHISPPPADPNEPLPPVELRFARYDLASAKMVGPITLDSDQPQPSPSTQGALRLEPLAEINVACNKDVCLVSYTRNVYNAYVDLNIPKLHIAVVDLATGTMKGTPTAVSDGDWDTQMFGHQLIALEDGSFVMVYTATDTAAAVNPKSPCDETLERDLLFAMKISASGTWSDPPAPIFDFEGTRQYPRIAVHPAGYALFWEDQRSECNPNGHLRMAMNVASPALDQLLDPYLEVPGSVGLPPEYPTLAVTGTNFAVGWSDNRHGNGILDSKSEIFLDSYWRK
ncbi:MAG: hypothetical protein HY898_16750 [Deltaproteobacteria bacterium]|nr:hypothetical protein [Deltaproteobacteria bacterium]